MKDRVDLVIKNGKIVTPFEVISAGIAINKGKIVAIAGESFLPDAKRAIDAKGNYILPGVVDSHLHLGYKLKLNNKRPKIEQ